jgi:hypothetical protein
MRPRLLNLIACELLDEPGPALLKDSIGNPYGPAMAIQASRRKS